MHKSFQFFFLMTRKNLFRKKKGLQPSACRHGKPCTYSGLHAKMQVYLQKWKGKLEFLVLMESNLPTLFLLLMAWYHQNKRKKNKEITTKSTVMKIYPCFSFQSFMISALIFRLSTHFEIIFVYSVRWSSNFILLYVEIQLSQHYLLKKLVFSSLNELVILVKINWPQMYIGLFLDYKIYSIDQYDYADASITLF